MKLNYSTNMNSKNIASSPSKQNLSPQYDINNSSASSQEKHSNPVQNMSEKFATNISYQSPGYKKENDVIKSSPRVTPYWEVLRETGITSPPLTRSASKKKRQRAERLQDMFYDKNIGLAYRKSSYLIFFRTLHYCIFIYKLLDLFIVNRPHKIYD